MSCCVLAAVPSAPRSLTLRLSQDDPPVLIIAWQVPKLTNGAVLGYRVRHGISGEGTAEERLLESDKYQTTTGFLGTVRK